MAMDVRGHLRQDRIRRLVVARCVGLPVHANVMPPLHSMQRDGRTDLDYCGDEDSDPDFDELCEFIRRWTTLLLQVRIVMRTARFVGCGCVREQLLALARVLLVRPNAAPQRLGRAPDLGLIDTIPTHCNSY